MPTPLSTPVQTVLRTIKRHGIRALPKGGQACILSGASEVSRDVDIAIFAHPENIAQLRVALDDLSAKVIAAPTFDPELLSRGHAVQFGCGSVDSLRLGVMSVMRGVPDLETCWARRTIYQLEGVGDVDVLGLEDLVATKKTRCDKDYPVVRRLVDAQYREFASEPTEARIAFWLRELRTPEVLVDCVRRAPETAAAVALEREAATFAIRAASKEVPFPTIRAALQVEEDRERAADEAFWRPLQNELEAIRHAAMG